MKKLFGNKSATRREASTSLFHYILDVVVRNDGSRCRVIGGDLDLGVRRCFRTCKQSCGVSVVLVLKTAKRITSNSSVTATKKGGGMQGVQPKGHHP